MLHDWDQDGFGYFCKRCGTRSRLGPGGAVAEELCPEAIAERPFIRTIAPEEATGELASQYEAAMKRAGRVLHLIRLSSLKPGLLRRWVSLYLDLMLGESDLPRIHREAIATVVAKTNGCHYLTEAHGEDLRALAGPELSLAIARDWRTAPVDPAFRAILAYAVKLTLKPQSCSKKDVDELRGHGWSDEAILTAAHVIGFFGHANRVAEGLGVPLEEFMGYPPPG